jgi:hypothetical protein
VKERDIAILLRAALVLGASVLLTKSKRNGPFKEEKASGTTQNPTEKEQQQLMPEKTKPQQWTPEERSHYSKERVYWFATVVLTAMAVGAAGLSAKYAFGALSASQDAVKAANNAVIEAQKQTVQAMRQAKAAEDQIAVAADTERRQLRAYVFITQSILPIDPSNNLIFRAVIKNFGQTPAYDFMNWTCLAVRDTSFETPVFPKHPVSDLTNRAKSLDTTGKLQNFTGETKSIIPPSDVKHKIGAPFCDPVATRPLTPEERSGIESGNKTLYAFGQITYRDAFREQRQTQYRLFLLDPKGLREGVLGDAREGNCADDDCPKE